MCWGEALFTQFSLKSNTKWKFLNVSYFEWQNTNDKELKLVDDPRFAISADLDELNRITDPLERQRMYDAIVLEIKQLVELGTFEWADLPAGSRPISSRLVLKVKYFASGEYNKHKARLTIRGCCQRAGKDYTESFAPTASSNSGRILDAVAVLNNWQLWQADIANAFCQAFVDVPVFLEMPRGIEIFDSEANPGTGPRRIRALKLIKALYGLVQSPRLFYQDLTKTLCDAGFRRCQFEPCLYQRFSKDGKRLYVLIYVDDLKICGDCADSWKVLQKALNNRYGLTGIEILDSFLGSSYVQGDGELKTEMSAKF